MNRRRLDFGSPIQKDGDANQAGAIGAGCSSAQVLSTAVGEGRKATAGASSTGVTAATDMQIGHRNMTPPRDFRVSNEAGTRVSGLDGRIKLTPQATGCSATGTTSRGMLTPIEPETAAGVDTAEEEQRFTHVSCSVFN
jgi:hypothetical protein